MKKEEKYLNLTNLDLFNEVENIVDELVSRETKALRQELASVSAKLKVSEILNHGLKVERECADNLTQSLSARLGELEEGIKEVVSDLSQYDARSVVYGTKIVSIGRSLQNLLNKQ